MRWGTAQTDSGLRGGVDVGVDVTSVRSINIGEGVIKEVETILAIVNGEIDISCCSSRASARDSVSEVILDDTRVTGDPVDVSRKTRISVGFSDSVEKGAIGGTSGPTFIERPLNYTTVGEDVKVVGVVSIVSDVVNSDANSKKFACIIVTMPESSAHSGNKVVRVAIFFVDGRASPCRSRVGVRRPICKSIVVAIRNVVKFGGDDMVSGSFSGIVGLFRTTHVGGVSDFKTIGDSVVRKTREENVRFVGMEAKEGVINYPAYPGAMRLIKTMVGTVARTPDRASKHVMSANLLLRANVGSTDGVFKVKVFLNANFAPEIVVGTFDNFARIPKVVDSILTLPTKVTQLALTQALGGEQCVVSNVDAGEPSITGDPMWDNGSVFEVIIMVIFRDINHFKFAFQFINSCSYSA